MGKAPFAAPPSHAGGLSTLPLRVSGLPLKAGDEPLTGELLTAPPYCAGDGPLCLPSVSDREDSEVEQLLPGREQQTQ